jgi:hypothetical protein
MEPTTFHLRQGPETLTALGGLPLVGEAMARFSQLRQLIDPRFPVRGGIANSDILLAQLGLLCQGKSDFEAIERYRRDPFFPKSLGLRAVPASPTLRQRLDEKAEAFLPWVDESNLQLLRRAKVDITSLPCGWVPLDMDVFTLDNSQTQKEGIGWTYAGYVGYAPIAAYLGREGWNIGMELREGTQHSAEETDATLDRVLPRAVALTSSPLLVRMDAGFHGKTIAQTLARHDQERQAAGGAPIAFLIKWNRRGQNLATRIAQRLADPTAVWDCPRSGKRSTIWEEVAHLGDVAVRRVLRLTERSSLANGQVLLLPETTLWKAGTPPCRRRSLRKRSSLSMPITPPTNSSMRRSRAIWIWNVCRRGSLPPTI